MLKIISIVFFTVSFLFSVEIDPVILQKIIADNPHAEKEKVILASYYTRKDNDLKALTLLDEVLKANDKNENANELKKTILEKQQNRELFRKIGLTYPVNSSAAKKYLKNKYLENDYDEYSIVYKVLIDNKIHLDDKCHIHAANIYLWDGKYELSANALENVEHKNNLEKTKIQADICYYTEKYDCSLKLFEKLYTISGDVNDGIKLVYSYMYSGQLEKARKLYYKLFQKNPDNKELKGAGSTLKDEKSKRLKMAQKNFENKRDLETLSRYSNILYTQGFKEKALTLMHEYNKVNASVRSLLLEAKYLSWTNKSGKALQILEPLSKEGNLDAKLLMGQIFSWNNDFEKATKYLNVVLAKTKDKTLLYESKKALAHVYKWDKNNEKAKALFTELHDSDKNDSEVIEALMELNGDYEGLIQRYTDKTSSGSGSGSGSKDTKRLSELYFQNNQKDKSIEALKAYLLDNPNDLEATKNLALMLIEKKEYYSGFGNLEYYTAQKNDTNSSLLLAQNYYWHGFSKESVDVLDKLLIKVPEDKEALELRAEILKVSPRFTTSNSGAKVNEYFEQVGLKQLEIADALYFNGHHDSSLMYYENYLGEEPTNHNVRLRYAFALENAGKFSKAEGEFYLMFWSNKTDEIKYHYGYNLMMNKKFDKAEEVFLDLRKSTFKTILPKLNSFVDNWKKAWQSKKYINYENYYSKEITRDEIWALSKQQTFKDVTFISVGLYDIVAKRADTNNTYIVQFYQEITTNNGTKKGNNILHVSCSNEYTECQIIKENFVEADYQKFVSLTPIINQRLKDIAIFRKNPRALEQVKSKKKNH